MELVVKYRNVIDGELTRISNQSYNEIISNYFELEMDDQKIESTNWRFYNNPQSSFLALVSTIPVDQLKKGEHILRGMKNGEVYFERNRFQSKYI